MATVTQRQREWRTATAPPHSSTMRRIAPPWTLPQVLASGGCIERAMTVRDSATVLPWRLTSPPATIGTSAPPALFTLPDALAPSRSRVVLIAPSQRCSRRPYPCDDSTPAALVGTSLPGRRAPDLLDVGL